MALPAGDLTIEEVIRAYECCRAQKRSAWTAIEFETNFSRNIMDIYNRVRDCTWKPDGHMCFVVMNPKPREVWASKFADRVVHHLVYNRLRPRFEPHWIATTFACIKDRGTTGASNWAERAARKVTRGWSQKAFVLQLDIRNFFPSINRSHLHDLLMPECNESWVRHLVNEVVNVDVRENAHFPGNSDLLELIPGHKSLWNARPGFGLPIGNLTSQFGANVYLSAMDQRIVRSGVARHYGRYVDDIVLMDADIIHGEPYQSEIDIMTVARIKEDKVVQVGLPLSLKSTQPDRLYALGWRQVKGLPKPTDGSGYEYTHPFTYDADEDAVYGTWQQTDIYEQIEKQKRESASLSRADFKLGLLEMGELDNVQALMDDPATDPRIKIMWEDSGRFERIHPELLRLAQVMGYTENQLDDIFGINS